MSFVKDLKVKIYLEKNSAALLTQRVEKERSNTFFSNLAGAIIGILGTIGFVMTTFEGYIEEFKAKGRQKCKISYLAQNRNKLVELNFEKKLAAINEFTFKAFQIDESVNALASVSQPVIYSGILTTEFKVDPQFFEDNTRIFVKTSQVMPIDT